MIEITYLGFAAALPVMFIVPGWLWLRRAGVSPRLALYGGMGVTVAVCGAVVGIGDLLPWSVPLTCTLSLVPAAASAAWCARSAPRPLLPERRELVGMAAFVAAFLATAAYVAVPSRPVQGYDQAGDTSIPPGLVDSARWSSLSDNTLPYRTGQVALHKLGGAQIRDAYSPGWWISDRTPLTGLAFAFAAGTLHVHVSTLDPAKHLSPMRVKDTFGFWAYNIVAIFLNLGIILGTYALAREWLADQRLAAVAAVLTAVMPGVFLNAIFTWPKQAVAYFLLIAMAFALRRRAALAGAFGALAYLCHPGGVWWLPALTLLLWSGRDRSVRWHAQLSRFAGTAVLVVLPWQLFCAIVLHATSRWTYAPLGYVMKNPIHPGKELSIAWHTFSANGLPYALWQRIMSVSQSLLSRDLTEPVTRAGGSSASTNVAAHWTNAHGLSFAGMVGLVLFPILLVTVVRRWPEFRRMAMWFALPGMAVALLGTGRTPPFLTETSFVMLGLFAVAGACALLAVSVRVRRILLIGIAIELLTVIWSTEYRPFNISFGSEAIFMSIALIGQIGLLITLGYVTGGIPLARFGGTRLRKPEISQIA